MDMELWPGSLEGRNLCLILQDIAVKRCRKSFNVNQPRCYFVDLNEDLKLSEEIVSAAIQFVDYLIVKFNSVCRPLKGDSWIFQLSNLKGLSLKSYPYKTLPEEVGNLTRLERFVSNYSKITQLPRSIGRLSCLKLIDCYMCYDLHYLPIEVLRCQNLESSKFSTRALFLNHNSNLKLPNVERLWWKTTPAKAPGFQLMRRRLGELLPDYVVALVVSFIEWNYCSICGRKYAHAAGCYVWIHQVIATDEIVLFAFCCGSRCANLANEQNKLDVKDQFGTSQSLSYVHIWEETTSVGNIARQEAFKREHILHWPIDLRSPIPSRRKMDGDSMNKPWFHFDGFENYNEYPAVTTGNWINHIEIETLFKPPDVRWNACCIV